MSKNIEEEIEQLIVNEVKALNRPDLFRVPIVDFSNASDEKYPKLKQIIGEWHLNPTELLPGANSVISYFVPFSKNVVLEPKNVKDGSPLWGEAYVVINEYFNHINDVISKYLSDLGYQASIVASTHTYDPKDMKSMWSHRSAAAIAGLGTFGANRMLITNKGSGGRFGTVITTAPLKTKIEFVENKCLYIKDGSCKLCIDACIVNALNIDSSFDKFACQDKVNENMELMEESINLAGADTCGKCISVCPVAYID